MRRFFYIFLFLCMIACGEDTKNGGNKINIPAQGVDAGICDIFTDISVIPLETNDSSFIGSISKIELSDGKIYVLDKSSTKQVHIFDTVGNYISSIGNIGRGNGEYLNIEDFTGWCVLTSMFLYQYPHQDNPSSYQRLIRTEKHPLMNWI